MYRYFLGIRVFMSIFYVNKRLCVGVVNFIIMGGDENFVV